ncbi:MAG TPA: XylR N-terminal domain-containing protein, partial [bacterium]|nr:XylR N-terminal domain-containing protein [bacterium]
MRVEDLDLKELLELNPDAGTIHFAGQRAMIGDTVSSGLLRQELIDLVGERTTRGVFNRFGYVHGRRMALALKSKFKWDSDEDWQKAGARILALQGLFMLDSASGETFGPKGGTWRVSNEAEQQILLKGRSDSPSCWTL